MPSPPRTHVAPVRRPLDTGIGSIVAVLATLLGLFVLAYVVLFVTKGRFLKSTFEAQASKFADRGVRVGGDFQLYLNPHVKFLAEDLNVDNPAWATERQLFSARRIATQADIWQLIGGTQRLHYLELDGGRVGAQIDAAGRNTWTFAGDEPFELPIVDRAAVTGSTLRFIDANSRADVRVRFGDITGANARGGAIGAGGAPTIGGPITFAGTGTALDAPFVLTGALTTPNEAAAGGRVGLIAHLEAAQSVADVSGTLPALTRFEGADLEFKGSGRSLRAVAQLFGRTAPATAYRLSGSVKPAADGRTRVRVVANAVDTDLDATALMRRFDTIDGADFNVSARGRDMNTIAGLFGQVAPRAPFRVSASILPEGAGKRVRIDANAAATKLGVRGLIPANNQIDGTPLDVTLSGENLQTASKLFGIVTPATRRYRLASNLTKTGDVYRFRRIAGTFGDSDIAGDLTANVGGTKPVLTGDLRTRVLDILDIGPWIGYSPAALDKGGGKAVIRQVGGTPRVIPDTTLAIGQLKAFEADIKYAAARIRTGNVPLTGLILDLSLKDSRLRLKPVAVNVIGGRMTASIDLNASVRPVVTDYDIRMSRIPLNQLLTSFDVEKSGTTASVFGRVQLRGEGDTMRESLATSDGRIALVFPAGTLWIRNLELAELDVQGYITAGLRERLKRPQQIRCGLVAFTVRDGIGRADPIVFDTERNNLRGTGNFSFRDESLDLGVRGDSKRFSLFAGQSPIGIGGYFAAPTIQPISRQLLTRAGVAVGLGLATGGLGAILAFVDVGDAKNVNCAAVQAAKTARQVDAAPSDPKRKRDRD